MNTFIATLFLSFVVIVVAMLWLSYCKRRQRYSKHGLTGMCHENGGTVCSSCAGLTQAPSPGACRGRVVAGVNAERQVAKRPF